MKRHKFLLIVLLLVFAGCQTEEAVPTLEVTPEIEPSLVVEEATFIADEATMPPTEEMTLTPTEEATPSISDEPSIQSQFVLPTAEDEMPGCQSELPTDALSLQEAGANIAENLIQLDGFQFHTIYQFTADGEYLPNQLAVEITGEYSEPRPYIDLPDYAFIPSIEQFYRSHIIATDLHTQAMNESIIVEDLTWAKLSNDSGWIEQKSFAETVYEMPMINLAEVLGPYYLFPSLDMQPLDYIGHIEELEAEGQTILHRCWHLDPTIEEFSFFALFHWYNFATILEEPEIHFWFNDEETQLLGLAITGEQVAEFVTDVGIVEEYDPPNQFRYQVEISNINQSADIQPPSPELIMMTIPESDEFLTSNAAEELPIPVDAVLISDPLREERDQDDFSSFKPFEFGVHQQNFTYLWTIDHLPSAWEELSYLSRPVYESSLTLPALFNFYIEGFAEQGWHLDSATLMLGSTYLLTFKNGSRIFPMMLEEIIGKPTRIWAFLPPDEAAVDAANKTWTTFTHDETGMYAGTIFGNPTGLIWFGGGDHITVYDGAKWTNYLTNSYGGGGNIALDPQGNIWATVEDGISIFDGEAWHTSEDIANAPFQLGLVNGFDQSGQFWTSVRNEDYVAVWNGTSWRYFASDSFGPCDFSTILGDSQGRVWFGKEDEQNSIFYFEPAEDAWYQVISDQTVQIEVNECGDVDSCSGSGEVISCIQYIEYIDAQHIVEDSNGRIWIGYGDGLKVFDGQTWTIYSTQSGDLPFEYLALMAIDHLDRLWVVSVSGGLYMLDESGEWQSILLGTDVELSSNFSDAIGVDSEGNIWIAANSIYKFEPPTP